MNPKGARVLVLAPHPDDETIGCGGAILLHRRQGDSVKVVFITDGAAGDPRGYYRGRDYRAIRRAEARKAASVLGVSELEFWDYADGSLNDSAGLRQRLKGLLESEKPAVVYRPSLKDPHSDHRALARSFERAARPLRPRFVDCRYEVCFLQKRPAAIDVTRVFAKKIAALRQYRSQLRYEDHLAQAKRLSLCRGLLLPRARRAEAFRISGPPGACAIGWQGRPNPPASRRRRKDAIPRPRSRRSSALS